MKAKVGSAGRKLVLIKLADNANDSGVCWPSFQHVADQCEMGRSTVKGHIKRLEEDGFLTVTERNGGNSSNKFQLHISVGRVSEKNKADPVRNEPGQNLTRSESDPLTRSESDPRTCHSFEPVNKKTSKKKRSPKPKTETERQAEVVAVHLATQILSVNPSAITKPKSWIAEIDKAIRIDGRTETELIAVVDWIYSPTGDFWKPHVLSGRKLREKFDTIRMQMNRGNGYGNGGQQSGRRAAQQGNGFANWAADQQRAMQSGNFDPGF